MSDKSMTNMMHPSTKRLRGKLGAAKTPEKVRETTQIHKIWNNGTLEDSLVSTLRLYFTSFIT